MDQRLTRSDIVLPKFDGKIEDWTIFRDKYETTTRLQGLTNVENLIRLEHSLRGEARQAVIHLLVKPEFVPDIIKILDQRYHVVVTSIGEEDEFVCIKCKKDVAARQQPSNLVLSPHVLPTETVETSKIQHIQQELSSSVVSTASVNTTFNTPPQQTPILRGYNLRSIQSFQPPHMMAMLNYAQRAANIQQFYGHQNDQRLMYPSRNDDQFQRNEGVPVLASIPVLQNQQIVQENIQASHKSPSIHLSQRSTDRRSLVCSQFTAKSNETNRRQQIELEIIEERRRLQEERDNKYLEEKYRILMEGRHGSEYSECRSKYTKDWVDKHSTQGQPINEEPGLEINEEFMNRFNDIRFGSTQPLKNIQQEEERISVKDQNIPHRTNQNTFERDQADKGHKNQDFNQTPVIESNSNSQPENNFTKQPVKEEQTKSTLLVNVITPSPGVERTLSNAQVALRYVVKKQLPNFDGKPEDWPMFLSRFQNSTELCGYSNSGNLDRLQDCLKGNALEAVRSRLLTVESVPQVIETLRMLYGCPELNVNALLKKIRNENPPQIEAAWKAWIQILSYVEEIQIPRLYSTKMSPDEPNSIQLHIFVDAGEKAFTAVAYIRVENDEGVDCVLVGSKSRVAPLKYLSIPRLELQSGVLGTRLLTSICNSQSFVVNRRILWTDSTTLLSWIQSDHRKYHQFVAHRIGEILEGTNVNEWRWIPTKQNVADEGTKWTKNFNFHHSNRWFSGPDFLKLSEEKWPTNQMIIEKDIPEEMKIHFAHTKLIVPDLIEVEDFSDWNKLIRAMAYARRYILILRARVLKEKFVKGPFTREELVAAEKLIFRQAQYDGFLEEMVILKRNQTLAVGQQKEIRKSSPIYKCSPYLDESGLLRIHGRIDLADDVLFDTKRPIILPNNNKITHLLVAHYHEMYHHRNNRTVYNEIRQKFYIPHLRVVLNSIRNKECQRCMNRRAKPQPPEMAILPKARLAIGLRPFTYLGIDYFGPIFVTVGRASVKRWGVIFMCLTVRAIKIEVAYTLNTASCIMCVRNFIALYGPPLEIYSDCGTNLKGMDNELKSLMADIDMNQMASAFTSTYTKWCFNPPKASHMGGSWERLIRSVKTSLYEIMPDRNPTDDVLRNLLLEVVNIVNSRPLTYIPLEHDEEEALTSNHFLLGSSNGLKPMFEMEDTGPILYSKWKENQRLADLFWQRFVQEYLPDLTRRTKWFQPVDPLKIGDIVVIIDKENKRNQYPKARVIDVVMDSIGQVRRVRVQKANKSMPWRPATGLAKLDVHRDTSDSLTVKPGISQTGGSVMNGSSGLQETNPTNSQVNSSN